MDVCHVYQWLSVELFVDPNKVIEFLDAGIGDSRMKDKGRSIYYVRIEGEGGLKNCPKLRTAVLIGCVKCE